MWKNLKEHAIQREEASFNRINSTLVESNQAQEGSKATLSTTLVDTKPLNLDDILVGYNTIVLDSEW